MDTHEEASERQGLPLHRVISSARGIGSAVLVGSLAVAAAVATVVSIASGASVLLSVLLAVVTLVLCIAAVALLRSAAAWDNPQLFLPSNDDLHLGDHVVVRYRRKARIGTDAEGASVRARLKVQERHRQADGQIAHHDIYTHDVPVVLSTMVDSVIEADLALDIPLYDAPPTMEVGGNEILWWLEATIDAPHAPNDTAEFALVVSPEVARRLLDGGVGR